MASPRHVSRSFLLALCGACCLLASPAWADDNSSQLSQAKEQLKTEHFADALASAKEAVRLDPEDYRGYYYMAMACMVLNKFDEAEAAAVRAEGLAPDTAKATITKLRATIATNRKGEEKVAAADAALAEGLMAKAAGLYREAWNAKQDKPDLALKAADLYANRLGEPVAAATLLREVMTAAQGTEAAEKALVQFNKLADTVKEIALQSFQEAKSAKYLSDARRWGDEARAADPDNKDISLWRAELESRGDDTPLFQAAIKDLARLGLASEQNLLGLSGIGMWMDRADFSEFLADVIGSEKVAHLKNIVDQRQAAAKAEAARQEAARQEAIRQAAVKAEADRLALAAELDALERDLKANSAVIVSKIDQMNALRKEQWAEFLHLLKASAWEKDVVARSEDRPSELFHFQTHIRVEPDLITIDSLWKEHPSTWTEKVVVAPGHLYVKELENFLTGVWQVEIRNDLGTAIKEIGETSFPQSSPARIWSDGKDSFVKLMMELDSRNIMERQYSMVRLHEEISSLFSTVEQQRQKLEAGGRKVSHDPIYSPAGRAQRKVAEVTHTTNKARDYDLNDAYNTDFSDAFRLLALAIAKNRDPDNREIYLLQATIAAQGKDLSLLEAEINDLSRHGLDSAETLCDLPGFPRWMQQPGFSEYLANAIGQEKLSQIQKLLAPPPAKPYFMISSLGLKMVELPAGQFVRERNKVMLSNSFHLGATEVTQAQWEAVMGSNPSKFRGNTLPVENVSWVEAMEFCRKLTERERAAGRLPDGYAYTLPTEAQWEYGCRAGTTGDFAGESSTMGWYEDNSGKTTHPVGQKQANTWGLSDMHGNVMEGCADWFGPYPQNDVIDPVGLTSGSKRVARGGCWDHSKTMCTSDFRLSYYAPDQRGRTLGFRIALSPVP